MEKIRIATRGSELALWQANHVADLLRAQTPDLEVELVDVTTSGDQDQSQPLRQLGGTGVFTREVQRAVIDRRADVAVHSLKDLPTAFVAPELVLASVPARANRWDALVLPVGNSSEVDPSDPLSCLPSGARIGSGSPRRQAQLLAVRDDLQILEIRGNLNTRLKKLDDGEYDAIILAAAGLERLGWNSRLSALLQPPLMYPAVGQGALGLECRTDDEETISVLNRLTDHETRLTTLVERSIMAKLQAGCHAPVGVTCQLEERLVTVETIVLSPDGQRVVSEMIQEDIPEAIPMDSDEALLVAFGIGCEVAESLFDLGAEKLIAESES